MREKLKNQAIVNGCNASIIGEKEDYSTIGINVLHESSTKAVFSYNDVSGIQTKLKASFVVYILYVYICIYTYRTVYTCIYSEDSYECDV